jgi:hypothetical protein
VTYDANESYSETGTDATTQSATTVSFLWTPSGIVAPQGYNFTFTFDPNGTLTQASGIVSSIALLGNYPLLAPTDAVASLNANDSYMDDRSYGFIGAPAMDTPSTTTPSTDGTQDVTIDDVQLNYSVANLSDGTAVLVPEYELAASSYGLFHVSALDPKYVNLAPVATPIVGMLQSPAIK